MSARTQLVYSSLLFLKKSYPKRILRIIAHIIPFLHNKNRLQSKVPNDWFGDLFFYLLDVILIPEIYEFIHILIRPNTRLLTEKEKNIVTTYFGQSIDSSNVKLNSKMNKKIEKFAYAYVSLNTINYRGSISIPILVHELVHVWQYQKYGSMYVYRSLHAQRTKEAYDYGGLEGLYNDMTKQKRITDYNFEQQAAIVEDYCRLLKDSNLNNSPLVIAAYRYFVVQLQD